MASPAREACECDSEAASAGGEEGQRSGSVRSVAGHSSTGCDASHSAHRRPAQHSTFVSAPTRDVRQKKMEKRKKFAKRGTRLHAVLSALATFFWRTSHELEAAPPPLCVPNVFLYSTLWTKAYHELESGQLDTTLSV